MGEVWKKASLYILSTLVVASALGNLVAGFFNSEMLLIFFLMIGIAIAIIFFGYFFVFNHDSTGQKIHSNLHDQFSRVNKLLKEFPSGEGLLWERGRTVNSQTATLGDKGDKCEYRSFLGNLEYSQEQILVIYNITKDAIADWYSDINVDLFRDHFHLMKTRMYGTQPPNDYWGRRYPHKYGKKPRFSIPLEANGDDNDHMEPDGETVKDVAEMSKPKM